MKPTRANYEECKASELEDFPYALFLRCTNPNLECYTIIAYGKYDYILEEWTARMEDPFRDEYTSYEIAENPFYTFEEWINTLPDR